MSRGNQYGIVAIIAVIFLLAAGIFYYERSTMIAPVVHTQAIEERAYPFTRSLDGIGVDTVEESRRRPVAIMIDNSSDARPSVGVDRASLIYETIAEGAITRQLAIFDQVNLPEKIGPVRSIRPYFLAWAGEVDAIVTHVGGSPEALENVKRYENINEFFAGQFFWRDKARLAPHNTFTSGEQLHDAFSLFDYATTTDILSWTYATSTDAGAIKADAVVVDFSVDQYKVVWIYNSHTGIYARTIDGKVEDAVTKNIIVQVVDSRVLDSELRRELTLNGSGTAWVIHNGTATIGNWIKGKNDKRTTFIDDEGNDLTLSPGITWVEVIDDENRVSFN